MTNTRRVGNGDFINFYEYYISNGNQEAAGSGYYISKDGCYAINKQYEGHYRLSVTDLSLMNDFYKKFRTSPEGDINYINRIIRRLKIK
jgi:hypothetical protein